MALRGRALPTSGGGLVAGDHGGADVQADRGEDVSLLAIRVLDEGDAGGAVRIVLDADDRGGDVALGALEVDLAVLLLVAAADVAGGDAAVVIAAAGALLDLEQALLGLALGDFLKRRKRLEAVRRSEGTKGFESHG